MKNPTMLTVNNINDLFNAIENVNVRYITTPTSQLLEAVLTIDEIKQLMLSDEAFNHVESVTSIYDFVIIYRKEIIEILKNILRNQNIVLDDNIEITIGHKRKKIFKISYCRKIFFYITEIKK